MSETSRSTCSAGEIGNAGPALEVGQAGNKQAKGARFGGLRRKLFGLDRVGGLCRGLHIRDREKARLLLLRESRRAQD